MAEHKDKIPGGLADKKKPADFNTSALKQGKKVESEHTSDKAIAQEIAMDHLTEDKKYYKKLKEVEKKDMIEVTSDGKQEIVEGKEPLKKDPKKKDLKEKWNDLKKALNSQIAFMDLAEAAAADPQPQEEEVDGNLASQDDENTELDPEMMDEEEGDEADASDDSEEAQDDDDHAMADPAPESDDSEGDDIQPPVESEVEQLDPNDVDEFEGQADEDETDGGGVDESDADGDEMVQDDDSTPVPEEGGPGDDDEFQEEGAEGDEESEEKIKQALQEQGYTDPEIAYIVHGHHSPAYDESKEAKAHATYAMSDIDSAHAKREGDQKLDMADKSHKVEMEAALKQKELEHSHQMRMKDLEYKHASMMTPDPETEKTHKKRMLDLEYQGAQQQLPDGSDKEHQKRMMDLEFQNAQAQAVDPAVAKKMQEFDIKEREIQLKLKEEQLKLELELKKKEHELKMKMMQENMKQQAKQKNQIAGEKHKHKLADAKKPAKKPLKKSFDFETGEVEVDDE